MRFFLTITVLLLSIFVTACGGGSPSSDNTSTSPETPSPSPTTAPSPTPAPKLITVDKAIDRCGNITDAPYDIYWQRGTELTTALSGTKGTVVTYEYEMEKSGNHLIYSSQNGESSSLRVIWDAPIIDYSFYRGVKEVSEEELACNCNTMEIYVPDNDARDISLYVADKRHVRRTSNSEGMRFHDVSICETESDQVYLWNPSNGRHAKFQGDLNVPNHEIFLNTSERSTTYSSNADFEPSTTIYANDSRLDERTIRIFEYSSQLSNTVVYPDFAETASHRMQISISSLLHDDFAPLTLDWKNNYLPEPISVRHVADMWKLYDRGEVPKSVDFAVPDISPITVEASDEALIFSGIDSDLFDVIYLWFFTSNASVLVYLDAATKSIDLEELGPLVDLWDLDRLYILVFDYEGAETFEQAMHFRFSPEINFNALAIGNYYIFE